MLPASGPSVTRPPPPCFRFERIETLPGLPNEDRAREILESLADDPGVRSVLEKHNWTVGALCELYPEGKVCVGVERVIGVCFDDLRRRYACKPPSPQAYTLSVLIALKNVHGVGVWGSETELDRVDFLRKRPPLAGWPLGCYCRDHFLGQVPSGKIFLSPGLPADVTADPANWR